MDVREKLMELLSEIIDGGFKWHNYCYESGEQLNNDEIASYLIAHGVTVQEWISVDDRLPDVGNIVLIYSETYGVCLDSYSDDTFDYFNVTHWMPLPPAPEDMK